MNHETYRLRLENLTLKLQQSPTQPNILQYLEARIALLEEHLGLHLPPEQDPKPQQIAKNTRH